MAAALAMGVGGRVPARSNTTEGGASGVEILPDGAWRKKHKNRFRNGALASIRMELGLAEVFLYHERICDLIDDAGKNEIVVSLFDLANDIYDTAGHCQLGAAEWMGSRTPILEQLRDRELVLFEGPVEPFTKLSISLPEATYTKYHQRAKRGDNGKSQPRNAGGTFAKSLHAPERTGTHRNDAVPATFPTGSHRIKTLDLRHKTPPTPPGGTEEGNPDPKIEEQYQDACRILADCLNTGTAEIRGWIEALNCTVGCDPQDALDAALEMSVEITAERLKPRGNGRGLFHSIVQRIAAQKRNGGFEQKHLRPGELDATAKSLRDYMASLETSQ